MSDAIDDAWSLSMALIADDSDATHDHFWTEQARRLATALILWDQGKNGPAANLKNIRKVLTAEAAARRELFNEIAESRIEPAATLIKPFTVASRAADTVIATAATATHFLDSKKAETLATASLTPELVVDLTHLHRARFFTK
jgi:type IV secretory pathway TraG/TraD family ATPase VirD4